MGLLIGGALTLVFLAGQIAGWRDLATSQFASPRDPALAFFYVLTVVHALHLLGGLVVWSRTLGRLAQSRRSPRVVRPDDVRVSVELCTVYWHYLLLVWLGLFAILLST
jgi:cytochrome c oxidase subunit III